MAANTEAPKSRGSRQREAERLSTWQRRVTASDKIYKEWESDFACDLLEEYYLGHQWKESIPGSHYTINMCYPTVETRIPSLMFFRPRVHVTPVPARADDQGSHLDARARLMEDTVQTLMWKSDVGFRESTQLALRESHYRFGVVEIGYSACCVDNPNAGRPVLNQDGSEMKDSSDQPVLQGEQTIEEESIYARRIPASNFRVSPRSTNVTTHNDWLGYFEYLHREDVLAMAKHGWKNTSQAKASGRVAEKYSAPSDDDRERDKADLVKVWKIWDLRSKTKSVFPESGDGFFVEAEPWYKTVSGKPYLNLAFLRQHPIMDSWYPLPPMFNWISPQDELNETRDMQKVHRKRALRRFLVQEGTIKDEELTKLETGGDMTWARTPRMDCIRPVEDAPLDRAVLANVPTTREDFGIVSGTPPERRGSPETATATQAAIIDTNSKIRDSFARQQVGEFLGDVIRIMLETVRSHFTLPMMIQINVDPASQMAPQEAMGVAAAWKEITWPDLGDLDFEVSVDVESLSPVTEDMARQQWTQVLGMLSNPTVAVFLLASPALLQKTLAYYGVRSGKDVSEIQKALQTVLAMAQQAAASEAAAKGKGGAAPAPAGGPGANLGAGGPASPDDIVAQLLAQIGPHGTGGPAPS